MSRASDNQIAIVGMACIFPGAGDLETFGRNVAGGHDAIRDVLPSRWDPEFYDPAASGPERVYCKRGGFVDEFASFDALRWGVMPVAAAGSEPDQLLALEVAAAALDDAGYPADGSGRPFARETTGILLGRGGYISRGMNRFATRARQSEELVQCLRRIVPGLTSEQVAAVRDEYQGWVGHHGPDTVIGIVPNLAASRIANRLDLGGPSYTLDAACASSLIAVERACADLVSGTSDMVLAGGVHLGQDVSFWSVFCQLGALSRKQTIRPFDRNADGILIGEGVGVVVLKRLADARRDGDRIYAVVRGSGVSSDGRGTSLMTPSIEGQVKALERAWRAAGLDPRAPEALGLVEAHGTGTPAGDQAELASLARVFGRPDESARPGLGSVKSMIGHAMPAAGVAGLIKAALALHTRTLPPTLHCSDPHDALGETRFRILSRAEPWPEPAGPRRAGVNAFGFGGINAHVILEEAERDAGPARVAVRVPGRAAGEAAASPSARAPLRQALLRLAADTPAALLAALDRCIAAGPVELGGGRCRLAVIDPTPERLAIARKVVERGAPFHGRKGIWFTPDGLVARGGRIAFVFPGIDADFQPRVDDVAAFMGLTGYDALETSGAPGGSSLERTGGGIVLVNDLVDRTLRELGVRPDVLCGHSIGEWSAMIAGGVLDTDEVKAFVGGLAPGSLDVPGVFFGTAGCSRERVEGVLDDLDEIVVSHDNCPHQVIVCGREDSVDEALSRLKRGGVLCQKLDFQSGFHTPLFRAYVEPLVANLERLALRPATTPLWSATTLSPYPDDAPGVRALFVEHLVRPVRFRELTLKLYDEGVRAFVQVGTGSLTGFLSDSLVGREHVALAANVPRRAGLEQLGQVLCALWVEGAEPAVERLFDDVCAQPDAAQARNAPARPDRRVLLDLGTPIVRLSDAHAPAADRALARDPAQAHELAEPRLAALRALEEAGSPLFAEYAATLRALERGGADVVGALEGARTRPVAATVSALPLTNGTPANGTPRAADAESAAAPGDGTGERTTVLRLDYERCPYLLDHCFFPQPAGWPEPGDRFPVVPMTMSLQMMLDAARELAPGKVVIALERVRALRWIAVEKPLDITIHARRDGERVFVRIDEYIQGEAVLADRYPSAPAAEQTPFEGEEPLPMDCRELYDERWMFHGPSYQGVVELSGICDAGIRGVVEERGAPGCMLDNAGQIFGLWIQQKSERDKMAMPVTMTSARFFGPDAEKGQRYDVKVSITSAGPQTVKADLEVSREGRVWCSIEGWEDRRFESDEEAWPVMLYPDRNALARAHPRIPGAFVLVPRLERVATRDYFARRFLSSPEIETYRSLNPRRQIEWLAGRIAAKDAVRSAIWERGADAVFPIEIEIIDEPSGRPTVVTQRASDLAVSIAHKRGIAVALLGRGRSPGIDVERVEPRDAAFEHTAFGEAERALLQRVAAGGEKRDEWIARFWAAKEALAKARGTGLGGAPGRFPIERVDGERIVVDGRPVDTLREGEWVLAWTFEEGRS